jgi:hypothetical protein
MMDLSPRKDLMSHSGFKNEICGSTKSMECLDRLGDLLDLFVKLLKQIHYTIVSVLLCVTLSL